MRTGLSGRAVALGRAASPSQETAMLLVVGSIVRPRMLHFTNHMLQVACGNGHVAWCRTAWRSFCRPPRRRAADGSRRPSGSCTSPPAAGATATPYNRLATRSHHAAETRMPRAARSAGFHSHAQGDIERTKRARACARAPCDSRACTRALVWAQEAGCLVLGRRHVRLQPRQLAVAPHLACAERSALY